MSEPLTIDVQETPNPQAVKLTLNRVIAATGTTYRNAGSADAAWAKELLGIPGVIQVFAVNNFVSVTKVPEAQWESVIPRAERVLRDAFGA